MQKQDKAERGTNMHAARCSSIEFNPRMHIEDRAEQQLAALLVAGGEGERDLIVSHACGASLLSFKGSLASS